MASNNKLDQISDEFTLLWVDGSVNLTKHNDDHDLKKLKRIVKDTRVCSSQQECLELLKKSPQKDFIVVTAKYIGTALIPSIHEMSQVHSIYIYCKDPRSLEPWAKNYSKILGLHSDIWRLCKVIDVDLKCAATPSFKILDYDVNNCMDSNSPDLNFIYSLLLKEALLDIEYVENDVKNKLSEFQTTEEETTSYDLCMITEFAKNYTPEKSIRWYTRESFVYKTVNFGLRSLHGLTLWYFGFFIKDLHNMIENHQKKYFKANATESFYVYRGQNLSINSLKRLASSEHCLMYFNSFLSTSLKREKALQFGKPSKSDKGQVQVLFKMAIDPEIKYCPFAEISEFSDSKEESEVLFSMNTVFRIESVSKTVGDDGAFQVELKLVDYQTGNLRAKIENRRKDCSDRTGLHLFGYLLTKLDQLETAERIYLSLLNSEEDEEIKVIYYNDLGCIKREQSQYQEALTYHKKALEIERKTYHSQHPTLAITYNNIGIAYMNLEQYENALTNFVLAENIQKLYPSDEDLNLSVTFHNIGLAQYNLGYHKEALKFYEESLSIKKELIPEQHESIARVEASMGVVQINLENYSEAVKCMEDALSNYRSSLPEGHPEIVRLQAHLAVAYKKRDDAFKRSQNK